MTYIIKASGEKQEFEKKKIFRTALKAGASKQFAEDVANDVEKRVYEGIKTREILKITLGLLKSKPEIAARYNLKKAIMSLGPSGFPFEEFFSQILKSYGYETKVGNNLKGKIINHEVDIIAKKKFNYMIECKYHNAPGIYTKSKVALYTYARFLDLKNNTKIKFDFPWLVTNTKCSSDAVNYAKSVDMKITSWQYSSDGKNLQELIEKKKLYPITILKSVKGHVKEKLSQARIILARSLVDYNLKELKIKTGLSEDILNEIIKEAHDVCFC